MQRTKLLCEAKKLADDARKLQREGRGAEAVALRYAAARLRKTADVLGRLEAIHARAGLRVLFTNPATAGATSELLRPVGGEGVLWPDGGEPTPYPPEREI